MAETTIPDYQENISGLDQVRNIPRGLTFDDFWAGMVELRESQKETDRQMKETDRKISKLGSRFGELIEHMIAPNIMNKFNELGFNFTKCALNVVVKETGNKNALAEVDIMLENGDIVIAVEVKSRPHMDDVNDHIQRMEKLRKAADLRQDKRRYQGAVAGAVMDDALRNYILSQGFYLIEQTGDTVQINIPEGFCPREW